MRHRSVSPVGYSRLCTFALPERFQTTGRVIVTALVVLSGFLNASAATKPNVILVMTDDNDQISWAIGGNCCEFLCFVGVSGGFQTAVVSGEFTGNREC
jgi:hypothetical protein